MRTRMMYRRMCVEKELKAPGQGQQGSEERRIDGNDVNKFISFFAVVYLR